MSDSSPKSVVEEVYRLFQAGESHAVAALMADDVFFREPPGHPKEGQWTGPDDTIAAAEEVQEVLRFVDVEIPDIVASDNQAIAHVVMTLEGLDGVTYQSEILEQWRVKDGKIIEVRPFYWNPGEIKRRNTKG